MFAQWSIRRKLGFCIGLLLVTVAALSVSSFFGVSEFRSLAKSIRLRAGELPLSSTLAQDVSKLHVTYRLYHASLVQRRATMSDMAPWELEEAMGNGVQSKLFKVEFNYLLDKVTTSFQNYSQQLTKNRSSDAYRQLQVHEQEQQAVEDFAAKLELIRNQSETVFDEVHHDYDFAMSSTLHSRPNKDTLNANFEEHSAQLAKLESLSNALPHYLHSSMENFADDVRWQYRALMVLNGIIGVVSALFLITLARLFYAWVFRPLETLVQGSRRVAGGDFEHRIQLDSQDEIAELAHAMNNMTSSFREIRDDLNQKVQQRTKEVVRGEQLASVGFLAAGVAHEINNPLASIAMCAESLDARWKELANDESPASDQQEVIHGYLKMMQDEAFRCKEITERLLDFSRLGDVEKQRANLTELIQSVIRVIQHLGKYKAKEIQFELDEPIYAYVNAREIKQVVLNLLTNSLDSLDAGGRVVVSLETNRQFAVLTVRDNGCGMSEEVLENLFEPFFTRRRDGQGTGLGMSITYRIVNDHGGDIQPFSDGPGKGSQFVVSLPLDGHDEKQNQIRSAA